jgi:ADP-ribosylation factor-like protein 6
VTPTVGYQVEEFVKHNLSFTILDMSGENRYRNLWERYYSDVQAVIFVVDSTDKIRMCVARDELDEMLNHADVKDRTFPILFFANKMDIPGASTPVDTMKTMGLERINNKAWHITSSNALTGAGVDEGVEWLAEKLIQRQDVQDSRGHK